jgi:hypothetical protein
VSGKTYHVKLDCITFSFFNVIPSAVEENICLENRENFNEVFLNLSDYLQFPFHRSDC